MKDHKHWFINHSLESSSASWALIHNLQSGILHNIYLHVRSLVESIITSPPEGVARYCFHPVCLFVCVSVYLSVCVCPANILVFYFSAIKRDIDLKFLQDTNRVVFNLLKTITFIGQMSRSHRRYIAFWRYSHITKIES